MPRDSAAPLHRDGITELVASWSHVPAFAHDKHLTVFAANRLATALLPGFSVGVNLARYTYLDPTVDRSNGQWSEAQETVAAILRDSLDNHEEDDAFVDIIGEVAALSGEFASAWAQDVRSRATGSFPFATERVGSLHLTYQQLEVPAADGDMLIVWRGSDAESTSRLEELAVLVAREG